jgi:hypothetical protein
MLTNSVGCDIIPATIHKNFQDVNELGVASGEVIRDRVIQVGCSPRFVASNFHILRLTTPRG